MRPLGRQSSECRGRDDNDRSTACGDIVEQRRKRGTDESQTFADKGVKAVAALRYDRQRADRWRRFTYEHLQSASALDQWQKLILAPAGIAGIALDQFDRAVP